MKTDPEFTVSHELFTENLCGAGLTVYDENDFARQAEALKIHIIHRRDGR